MHQTRIFEINGLSAGVDEAGRGSLAGPVVASAVLLHPHSSIDGLADSKKLTEKRRNELAIIIKQQSLAWSVAWADSVEIDAINILCATMLAMRRAIIGLEITPARVLVDGNQLPNLNFNGVVMAGEAIIGGDDKVDAISAASIIAKTTRDLMMCKLDRVFPNYEFAKHKGYGTKIHRSRLQKFGPCREHRQTFAPVRAATE
ncbi:MAG: ribonuclease HII [Woeseiaceae bacterium]|nr:ribonuclease HII [Woeseiaceae bacterium]